MQHILIHLIWILIFLRFGICGNGNGNDGNGNGDGDDMRTCPTAIISTPQCPPVDSIIASCSVHSNCSHDAMCCSDGCNLACMAVKGPTISLVAQNVERTLITCPKVNISTSLCPPKGSIIELCTNDSDCTEDQMCCSDGCNWFCMRNFIKIIPTTKTIGIESTLMCPDIESTITKCPPPDVVLNRCVHNNNCYNNEKCCYDGCYLTCTEGIEETPERLIEKVTANLTNLLNKSTAEEVYKMKDDFLDRINSMMSSDPTHMARAQKEDKSADIILGDLEIFARKLGTYLKQRLNTSTGDNSTTIQLKRNNIAVYVSAIPKADVRITADMNESLVSIDLQPNAEKDDLKVDRDFRGSVFIPISSLNISEGQLIYMYVYRTPILFVNEDRAKAVNSRTKRKQQKARRRINSFVIAISIGNQENTLLPKPIVLTFRKLTKMKGRSYCVFWNSPEAVTNSHHKGVKNDGEWSTPGCKLVNETSDGIATCECEHLTNFAILLDVSQKQLNYLELDLITWIGCCLSILGLVLTISFHLSIKTLRKRLPSKLLLFLCVCLLILLILFLAGVDKTEDQLTCQVISGILQYFLISTFTWMAVTAINMYRYFVMVLDRGDDYKFLIKASVLAWGVPAIIVICTGVVEPANLSNDNFCFVQGLSFYIGVLVPVAMILLANILIIFRVLRVLSRGSVAAQQMDMVKQCKIALIMSVLIGVTWLFAFFAIDKATYIFQLLFCIFNSLQGFFLFILMTGMNDEVRKKVFKCCPALRGKKSETERTELETMTGNQIDIEEESTKRTTLLDESNNDSV